MADRITADQIEAALAEMAEPATNAVLAMPDPAAIGDLEGWSRREASDLAEIGMIRNDDQSLQVVALLLETFAAQPITTGFSWRFVVALGIDQPFVPFELGFSPAAGPEDAALDAMIGADLPSDHGLHVATFDCGGRAGRHCLRLDLRSPETGEPADVGALWMTAGVACRRTLPKAGETDVLAVAVTPYLDQLLVALPSIYEVVVGDYLADLVESAVQARP